MLRFLYTQTKAGMTKDKYFIKEKVFFSPADPKQINDVDFFRQYNLKLSCLYGKKSQGPFLCILDIQNTGKI